MGNNDQTYTNSENPTTAEPVPTPTPIDTSPNETSNGTYEVKGGDTVKIKFGDSYRKYEIEGYITDGKGENVIVYIDKSNGAAYYMGDDKKLIRIKEKDVDSMGEYHEVAHKGEMFEPSSNDKEYLESISYNSSSKKSSSNSSAWVMVSPGTPYPNDPTKINIWPWPVFVDMTHPFNIGSKVVGDPVSEVTSATNTLLLGATGGLGVEMVRDVLNSDNNTNDSSIDYRYASGANIEYYLNRELNVKRKRYYFTYYDMDTITKGPYDAVDMRDLAEQTFKMTPGQGRGADYNSGLIEGCIGSVRNILEDVIKYAQDAVIINGNNPGLQLAKEYESKLDEVVPPIYRKFADKCLPKAFAYSNNKQKESNENKRKEVLRTKQITYNMYKDHFNEDELASLLKNMKITDSNIDEDLDKKYKAYRTGNEKTQSTPAVLSSLPVGTNETVNVDDMSVHIGKTDIIIDDLRLALNNYVKGALDLIDYQVSQINAIPSFTSVVGVLKAEHVNSTLIELRTNLRSLREKYIGWREQAINVSQNKTAPVNPTPGPSSWPSNGGGGTSGSTVTPTTPKTEVPTDNRPTEPVVQPRIDDKTDNGGSNGGGTPINGNSRGGDYSPYGGYNGSSSETLAEVPKEAEDVIKKGNTYKLPTSSKPVQPTTSTTSRGNSVIPVLAGLAAAAAAGIGAKTYIDRKKNRNNDEESEEYKTEDWSGNNEINIEYQEPKTTEIETLDDDYDFEEPEKYGARSNQELEDLQ